MMRRIVATAFALYLSACAGVVRGPAADADQIAIKRVAVVSVLGSTFRGVTSGVTVLSRSEWSSDVSEWKIDDNASSLMLASLRTSEKLESGRLDLGGRRVESLYKTPDGTTLDIDGLLELAKQQRFDTLLILKRAIDPNDARFGAGYGLKERTLAFGIGGWRSTLFKSTLNVYSVQSKRQIAWDWAGSASGSVARVDVPWRDNLESFTPVERATIREALERRIATDVKAAIANLRLAPSK